MEMEASLGTGLMNRLVVILVNCLCELFKISPHELCD